MSLQTKTVEYHDGETLLEGYLAYTEADTRPTILLAHMWAGRVEFICDKARTFAKMGFNAFAIDMYGKDVIGNNKDECAALMQPFIDNRAMLQQRIISGLEAAKTLPIVDENNIVALGYCFGGMCVLDLARSGADIKGAISIHGLLQPPPPELSKPVKAKVLVLHGSNDPMADQQSLLQLGNELSTDNADWQAIIYGNAMHAFTNPNANDVAFGTVYNADADKRSWWAIQQFLGETFNT